MKRNERHQTCLMFVILSMMLLGCGTGKFNSLMQKLREGSVRERCIAAHELAKLAPDKESVVMALAAATKDPEPLVQVAASEALRAIGPAARPALAELNLTLQLPDPQMRLAAARAVCAIDPDNELYQAVLSDALRAGNAPMFPEIGQLGKKATWAVPVLLEVVRDSRYQVRALAAQTLGDIGANSPEVERALKQLTKDREKAVRYAAEDALERLQATSMEEKVN